MMYRRTPTLEVFLVHPGGPLWAKKDLAAWTIPKGEYTGDEEPLAAAIREFAEETGFIAPAAPHPYIDLGTITQPNGKLVRAWAFEGDCDPGSLVSNTCTIEWPPRTGRALTIPEVDRGAWFTLVNASDRIFKGQQPLLERLAQTLV
ncbi:MAG: NUDIX domain-containing protein [Acidobacteria bacterium]|nr:NUDIX domain-containing protein [Acidobacteriota bacterium]